jgi:hypothetical protein
MIRAHVWVGLVGLKFNSQQPKSFHAKVQPTFHALYKGAIVSPNTLENTLQSGKSIRVRTFSLLQSQKVTKYECPQRNHHVLSKM